MTTAVAKPIISSTVGFRVNPGGSQLGLYRDDSGVHARTCDRPVMIGCVTALTRIHKDNGATTVLTGSYLWEGEDRVPLVEKAVPAELEPSDATPCLGRQYHAGRGNINKDERRGTVGILMAKGAYRQVENEYLMVPPGGCKELELTPAESRVLGYGIAPPVIGFVNYKDPIESIFGIVDDGTVRM